VAGHSLPKRVILDGSSTGLKESDVTVSGDDTVETRAGRLFVRSALANARQFVKDANALLKTRSYGHAAALAVLSMEEAAKAWKALQYVNSQGHFRVDVRTYTEEFKVHWEKMTTLATDYAVRNFVRLLMPEDRQYTWDELLKRTKRLIEGAEEEKQKETEIQTDMFLAYTILKLKWLYVDIENGHVSSPLNWSRRDAEIIFRQARQVVRWYSDRVRGRERRRILDFHVDVRHPAKARYKSKRTGERR